MPGHWTYDVWDEASDLRQGDILAPTDELRQLFAEVHPHFCHDKYLAFIVTTQSCDLVRRQGECSARYINVAVIRSLKEVLFTLLETVCSPIQPGVYADKDKSRGHDLLERIFNQNEQKLGLFYLYPDASLELGEDAVAFLRVSVAFRVQHYVLMLWSRRGRLRPEFANKLGWLVGNLYSRVGTPDWPEPALREMVRAYLSTEGSEGPIWIKSDVLSRLHKDGLELAELSREQLLEAAMSQVPRPKMVAITRIMNVIRDVVPSLDEAVLSQLQRRLTNDGALSSTFRS